MAAVCTFRIVFVDDQVIEYLCSIISEQQKAGALFKKIFDTLLAEIKEVLVIESRTTDASVDVQTERMEKLFTRIYSDLVKFFYIKKHAELDGCRELQLFSEHFFAACLGITAEQLIESAKSLDEPDRNRLEVFSSFVINTVGALNLIKDGLLAFTSSLDNQSLSLDFGIYSDKVLPVLSENVGMAIPRTIARSTVVDESVNEQISDYILYAFKSEVYDPYQAHVDASVGRGCIADVVRRAPAADDRHEEIRDYCVIQ